MKQSLSPRTLSIFVLLAKHSRAQRAVEIGSPLAPIVQMAVAMHLNYYLTFRLSATSVFHQLSTCLNPLALHRQLPSLGFLDRAIVETLHLLDPVFVVSVLV
jgi:hypothetical protein